MYCDGIRVEVDNISKSYQLYDRPQDRLKQSILPKLHRLLGKPPRAFYREFQALKNVSFQVRRGETLGIIGRNGSGKSTLLQIVCGTLYPTTGRVETQGRLAALLELGAGFNTEFTGRENVYMNAAVLGLSPGEIADRFDDIVEFAEIGEFIDQPLKTYSTGMYMRLAFSVIANVDAEILIIDEALAVGDAFFVQKCMRFLRKFQETGTVLFVSHDTAAVTSLCNRAVWLDDGVMVADGVAKHVCEEYFAVRHLEDAGVRNITSRIKRRRQPRRGSAEPVDAFESNLYSAEFGKGDATIVSVDLLDTSGTPLTSAQGGEDVKVVIHAICNRDVESPIMGFHIKDRLGQALIGDNTFLACKGTPAAALAGDYLEARFVFALPLLASGTYSVCAAIASGTPLDHVQHHWIHDALLFTVHTSRLTGVLVGVPMKTIDFAVKRHPKSSLVL